MADLSQIFTLAIIGIAMVFLSLLALQYTVIGISKLVMSHPTDHATTTAHAKPISVEPARVESGHAKISEEENNMLYNVKPKITTVINRNVSSRVRVQPIPTRSNAIETDIAAIVVAINKYRSSQNSNRS